MTTPRLLTTAEAAHQLTVSTSTIRQLVKKGVLPARRIGSVIRISQQDLDSLGCPAAPVPAPGHWKSALAAIELPR